MTEIFPGGGTDGANVAFMEWSVLSTPRQFGPTIRTPAARQISTSSFSAAAPAAPTSLNPAVMTMTEFRAGINGLAQRVLHKFAGDDDDAQLDLSLVFVERLVAFEAEDFGGPGVDRHDGTLEAAVDQIGQHRVADLFRTARGTDDGDALRI